MVIWLVLYTYLMKEWIKDHLSVDSVTIKKKHIENAIFRNFPEASGYDFDVSFVLAVRAPFHRGNSCFKWVVCLKLGYLAWYKFKTWYFTYFVITLSVLYIYRVCVHIAVIWLLLFCISFREGFSEGPNL